MRESTVQDVLCQGEYGTILSAINDVEEQIERKEIKFPRLVVFGDESAGKSSLMEAICNVPLPSGSEITTRAVMNVRLRRGPRRIKVWSTYKHSTLPREEDEVEDDKELWDAISERQKLEIEEQTMQLPEAEGRQFVENPITIEICDQGNPDLTLVDLPGFFLNKATDESLGTYADKEFIEGVLREYLEDSSSILLIVVAADVNIRTVNILTFIREFAERLDAEKRENLQKRTIYCLTKCDNVDPKTGGKEPHQDIKKLMDNQGYIKAYPHGWYAVVNHLSKLERRRKDKLEKDREEEEKFFENNETYTKFQKRCGIPNLVLKLTQILKKEIMRSIPHIRAELDMKISEFEKRSNELGPAPRMPDRERGLEQIVDDVKTHFREATFGNTQSLFDTAERNSSDLTRLEQETCRLSRFRSDRVDDFKQAIHHMRPALDEHSRGEPDEFREEVTKMLGYAKDGMLEKALPNKDVPVNLVRQMAKKWRDLAEQMYRDIAGQAISCLKVIIKVNAGQYKQLPNILDQLAEEVVAEQEREALKRLMWHYVDEVCRPDTMNEKFQVEFDKAGPPGMSNKDESTVDTFIKVFMAIFPEIENRFIDNATRTVTTHIFDVVMDNLRSRNDLDRRFDHKLAATDVRKFVRKNKENSKLDEEAIHRFLFELKDDRKRRSEILEKQIRTLRDLRSVLILKPSEFLELQPVEDDVSVVTDNIMNGIQSYIHINDD